MLVHGWCCDHTYFASQIEHFAGRGHRVVAVDLRRHGQSDKPHQRYAMQDFADDLAWMCLRLELAKPVVVGHSMGGIVAFDLAARYSDLPSAVVMLDAAVVLPSAARAAISSLLEELRGYAARSLFVPTDDEHRKERILRGMSSAPQHVVVSALEGLRDYDPTEAARRAGGTGRLHSSRRASAALRHGALTRDVLRYPLRQDRGLRALLPAGGARAGRRDDRAFPRRRAATNTSVLEWAILPTVPL